MVAHRLYRTALAGLVIASISLLGACSQGPGSKPADKEPDPPPPLPTLLGTWQSVHTYTNEDGVRETETFTLTFTKSRFIESNRGEREGEDWHWSHSGTWTSTDTTVTKIYHYWDEEIDARSEEPIEVVKEYLWGDAERNTLLVHLWGDDDPVNSFNRYTRLEDPIPGGLAGTWVQRFTWDDDEDGEVENTLTYTITTDTFTEHETEVRNGEVETNTLSGTLTIDREDQFLKVVVTSASQERNGEPEEDFDDTEFVGHELRYGYAASGQPDKLSISTRWNELDWNDETMMYENDKESPYGNYWRLFTRSQEAQ